MLRAPHFRGPTLNVCKLSGEIGISRSGNAVVYISGELHAACYVININHCFFNYFTIQVSNLYFNSYVYFFNVVPLPNVCYRPRTS